MQVLRNADLIVGDGQFLHGTDVLVDQGRIVDIGVNLPGEDTIDLTGMTLLPGLIDAHVHLVMSGEVNPMAITSRSVPYLALAAARNARLTLDAGFTTVRDLGGPEFINVALKQAIEEGVIFGPRVLACGRMIAMTGGHGADLGARIADGVDECMKAAREQIRGGADVVKLMATGGVLTEHNDPRAYQLNEQEMAAAIHEAHKAGKSTAAHAHGTDGIKNAVRAGIDSIEHGTYADEEALDLMAARHTSLVICIHATQAPLLPGAQGAGMPSFVSDKNRAVLEHQLETFRCARSKGVEVVMGTDSGTPLNPHGRNAGELVIFVANGMSTMEAIEASTLRAARLLQISEDVGSIEQGKVADLIAVDGNPLDDIARLGRVFFVMQNGRVVRDVR